MEKNKLVETVIEATGLPQNALEKEFKGLLDKHDKSAENLTLEDLREVMADYLQTVFLEMQSESVNESA